MRVLSAFKEELYTLIVTAAFVVTLTFPTFSMTVSPLVLEMSTTGDNSKSKLQITNDGAKVMPIEVIVHRMELDELGESTLTRADKELTVFPTQVTIQPGLHQTIRVEWPKLAVLQKSQTYVLEVKQMPVKFADEKSGVQMVFHFSVIVNVAPQDGVVNLSVKNVGVVTDKKGIKHPVITVVNTGTRHASLGDTNITLSSGKWKTTIESSSLQETLGVALVQPGKQRRFLLTPSVPPEVTAIKANLDYKPTAK